MDIIVRQATIIDPSSPFHLQKADLFISAGKIRSIQERYEGPAETVIAHTGLFVSPGWIDAFADFCDPGYEFRETLQTGAAAAAAGGFTDVMLLPHTHPVIHNKGGCEYLVQASRALPVRLHPIGAVSKGTEGKELAEMYDMARSGAVAFGDGNHSLQSAGVMLKALQYVKAIEKTIIQLPDDQSIGTNGLMHEGVVSTGLGLPGKPAIAEGLAIARDIELVRYTDSRLHFTGVSSKEGLALIREAKKEGLKVSCSVTPYHLVYCDEDLRHYDTNLKVTPPLRTARDREAIREAVLDGTVDCIASHHSPQDTDHKVVEFEYANPGMISLQTSFAAVCTALPQLGAERLVELFYSNAARIFDLPRKRIDIGEEASLTLFSLDQDWTFEPADNRSRSRNTPFFGFPFAGKPLGIINKDRVFLSQ